MTDFNRQDTGSDSNAPGPAVSPSKLFLVRFLALGEHERLAAESDPLVHRELWFQAAALIVCPLWFGLTVANVGHNLFEFDWLKSMGMFIVAAFGLWLIDSYYLTQTRGVGGVSGGILKVRLLTAFLLLVSSTLMATYSFKDDINRVLGDERAARRAQLEQLPLYRLDPLREDVSRAEEATARVADLRLAIGQLELDRAQALESMRNECEGNTTDGRARARGCGARARGYEAAADRLAKQLVVLNAQLAQAQAQAKALPQAQAHLAEAEKAIDAATARATGGPMKRIAALVGLIVATPWSFVIMAWWMAFGAILDYPIWAAQGKSFNGPDFTKARKLDKEALELRFTRWQALLREQQATLLPEIEVGFETPARHRHEPQAVADFTPGLGASPLPA